MKLSFLRLAAAALLLTTAAHAQEPAARPAKAPRSADERSAAMTKRMTHDLSLSPEQQAKVADLNRQYAQQLEPLRPTEAERAARKERHAKARATRDAYEAQLHQILNPEQQAVHERLRAERKEKMKARYGAGRSQGKRGGKHQPAPAGTPPSTD